MKDNSREKQGSFASIVGIIVNFLLSGLKLTAGLISASVAITADALNNLSDAGASAVTLISFKLASKPADKDHPFGHARIEYIASMIVSFLILLVGFEVISDSFSTLIHPDEAAQSEFSLLTLVILGVSVIAKVALGLYYRAVGNKIDSSALKASGVDSLSDSISTLAVLISSIVIKFTGLYIIDAVMGIVVSVLIFVAGIKVLNETKNSLLGEAPVKETVEDIERIVGEFPEILGIHDMMVHNYGPSNLVASLHAEVDGDGDIYYLHDVIDNVERRIHAELGIYCTIHMDPIVTKDETVCALREFLTGIVGSVLPEVTVHDFRVVIGQTHTNLIFDIVLPFESKISPAEAERLIKEAVFASRGDCYCVITVDRA